MSMIGGWGRDTGGRDTAGEVDVESWIQCQSRVTLVVTCTKHRTTPAARPLRQLLVCLSWLIKNWSTNRDAAFFKTQVTFRITRSNGSHGLRNRETVVVPTCSYRQESQGGYPATILMHQAPTEQ